MTLIKGPIYSLFLAVASILHIPFQLFHALLYSIACLYLLNAIKSIIPIKKTFYYLIYLVILFNPFVLPLRVLRDYIYSDFIFIIIGAIVYIYHYRDNRIKLKKHSIVLGFAIFSFWFTREEGIWLTPIFIAYILILIFIKNKSSFIKSLIFSLITLFSLTSAVSLLNLYHYKTSSIVDFTDGDFKHAIGLLSHITASPTKDDHIPVSEEKRLIAYSVSPTFRTLQPILEDKNNPWKTTTCTIYPLACGDFAGGWFMWALREATAQSGHYSSPEIKREFYNSISNELQTACDNKVIECTDPSLFNFLPSLPDNFVTKFLQKYREGLKLLFLYNKPMDNWGYSSYSESALKITRPTYLYPSADYDAVRYYSGYIKSDNNNLFLCNNEDCRKVQMSPSPDLVSHFNNEKYSNIRFSFLSFKDSKLCLNVSPAKECLSLNVPSKSAINNNSLNIHFDTMDYYLKKSNHSVKTNNYVFNFYIAYKFIIILLVVGALRGLFSLKYTWKNKENQLVLLLSFTIASCIGLRIVMLALIDITSFPGFDQHYLSPAYSLLLLMLVLLSTLKFKGSSS